MTDEPKITFAAGIGVGIVLAVASNVVVERISNNQADYWRGAFCMEAQDPPNFCVQDKQFQYYLDTMAMVIGNMKETSHE